MYIHEDLHIHQWTSALMQLKKSVKVSEKWVEVMKVSQNSHLSETMTHMA